VVVLMERAQDPVVAPPARNLAPDLRALHVSDAEVDPGPHARVDDRVGQL
jgi:hypothetical protein